MNSFTPQKDLANTGNASNVMDYLFGGEFESTEKCVEPGVDDVRTSKENFRIVKCFIDEKINYIHEGLSKGMKDQKERRIPQV